MTYSKTQLEETLPKLTAWFSPEDHKERKLPGGGRWFYVPHQEITKRLNDVCPSEWQTKIASTNIAGDYTVVILELTICGVTRTGIGDDKTFPEVNDQGKAKIIGTPPVRAFRNAFKDACEQFGICAYLDEQSSNKAAFIKFMQSKGDMRAYKYAQENDWTKNGAMGRTIPATVPEKPTDNQVSPSLITDGQAHRLWAIAKNELKLSDDQVKSAYKHFGFEKTEMIASNKYEEIIEFLRSLTKTKSEDLYPQNNLLVKQIRAITKQDVAWVYAQCKVHGSSAPGMMPPEVLEKLIADMCVDWAVVNKVIGDRSGAYTSIQSAINFARSSGQSITSAALTWLERHNKVGIKP